MAGRVLGAHHGALLFGVSLGPALGGLIADGFGLQAPCVIVGLSSVVTALYSFVQLPETNPNSLTASVAALKSDRSQQPHGNSELDSRSSFSAAAAMLRDPRLLAAGVANASTFALRQGGSE